MAEWTRTVTVAPERLAGWIERFADAHGDLRRASEPDAVIIAAADEAKARIEVPFPPLQPGGDPVAALLCHVLFERSVGVLLVRRRGHAAGVFRGQQLVASAVGSAYVQGTTKAGGWSQQRYARRRAHQARNAYEHAADDAAEVLLPRLAELDAFVTGGDRAGVRAVLADPRLSPLAAVAAPRLLAVPDPRRRVLLELPAQLYAVRIDLNAVA